MGIGPEEELGLERALRTPLMVYNHVYVPTVLRAANGFCLLFLQLFCCSMFQSSFVITVPFNFQWMQQLWETNKDCYVRKHNLKPENICSIIIYLSEVQYVL